MQDARIPFEEAVEASCVLRELVKFDPHIAGTPPLGIAIAGSDIDILCSFADGFEFTKTVVKSFRRCQDFTIKQWRRWPRAIIARFRCCGWEFEIYADGTPVPGQAAWRHYKVEERLLKLGGQPMRDEVVSMKQRGFKTEPAFAHVLMLTGDPYARLLEIELMTDEELAHLIATAISAKAPFERDML